MLRLFWIIVMILVAYVPANAGDNAFKSDIGMKIHFYEFQIVTYAPITLNGIVTTSDYKIDFYSKHKFIKKMEKILTNSKTNKAFDNNNVRLRVEMLEGNKLKIYGVDSNGVVSVEKTNKLYQLSRKDMESIQNSILGFHGVVDKKPDFNPEGPLTE